VGWWRDDSEVGGVIFCVDFGVLGVSVCFFAAARGSHRLTLGDDGSLKRPEESTHPGQPEGCPTSGLARLATTWYLLLSEIVSMRLWHRQKGGAASRDVHRLRLRDSFRHGLRYISENVLSATLRRFPHTPQDA